MMLLHRSLKRSSLVPFTKIAKHATQIRCVAGYNSGNYASGIDVLTNLRQQEDQRDTRHSISQYPWKNADFPAEPSHQQTRTPYETFHSRGREPITESQNLRISHEVLWATRNNRPVVALESTIYTHGFPYPDNLSLAFDLERIVRDHGAIPATIGIIDGVACIGVSKEELTTLASSAGNPRTMKISRRDLPFILGKVSPRGKFTSTIAYSSTGNDWHEA
jgi:hypothetical protein